MTNLVDIRLDVSPGDVQERLLDVARRHPLARVAWAGGEVWLVNDPELVRLAFRDRRLTKEADAAPDWFDDATGMIGSAQTSRAAALITSEGAEHTRQRKLHAAVFSARHRERWEQLITEVVHDLLRTLDGEVDLVPRLAYPLPVAVISAVLGLPPEMREPLVEACRLVTHGADDAERERGRVQLYGGVGAFLGPRRHELRPGMIADLLALHEADGSVSTVEIATWTPGLVIPGHESTTSVLAALLADVLDEPPDRRPATAREVEARVEATLCANPPFPLATWRFTTSPVLLQEHEIPAGKPVLLNISAFNHASPPTAHYTFGYGAHYCVGAALARAELRIALTEFLREFPDATRTTGETRWVSGYAIRQLTSLPVRLVPAGGPA
ncbi:cytochrome P450 [Saccharothrix syringae]|uniref:Cytochrome P450 n=1 Tax=Saccharothrix syringae TaxID=103733 RepID=A0A5Q0GXH7_SACSY|nr:cytochrome P450 [Saccharothrix syringae]QFZ18689.1 cytochrome P450 [Saccharothrix syringae]